LGNSTVFDANRLFFLSEPKAEAERNDNQSDREKKMAIHHRHPFRLVFHIDVVLPVDRTHHTTHPLKVVFKGMPSVWIIAANFRHGHRMNG
jgi:hypothetical protein